LYKNLFSLLCFLVSSASIVSAEQIKIICGYVDADDTLIIDYDTSTSQGYIHFDGCLELQSIDVDSSKIRMQCSLGGWENGQKIYHDINRYTGKIVTTWITMTGNNIIHHGECEQLGERKF